MNNKITFGKVQNDGYCKIVSIYANKEFVANISSVKDDGEFGYYCTDTNELLGASSNTDFETLAEAKREIKSDFVWDFF